MFRKTVVSMVLLVGTVMFLSHCAGSQQIQPKSEPASEVHAGWQLGIQAWTFHRFTFYEAVDKTASVGLKWIEAVQGQRLSKEKPNVRFDQTMSAEIREEVRQKLSSAGIKLINCYIHKMPNDEAKCREIFDFVEDMGIKVIVSEPEPEALDLIESLCKEYKIKLAIHNHPKPSRYWDPDKVLAVCKGRSKWIGVCADTGHWMRVGLKPVEVLKKLEGRVISFHLKDLQEIGNPAAHDVIWGTGKGDVKGILQEMHRQRFKGLFAVEYEYNWENSLPDIRQCVEYFNKAASELRTERMVSAAGEKRRGPFNGRDLNAWQFKGDKSKSKWVVGIAEMSTENPKLLTAKKGVGEMINTAREHRDSVDIYSKAKFGDCRIELEVMVPKGSNSGIYVMGEYEVQVLDSYGREKMGWSDMGAIYGAAVPSINACKKPGEWQKYVIEFLAPRFDVAGEKIANAKFVKVELNGRVLHENLEMPGPTPAGVTGTESPTGPIMFQGDHGPVAYRNIRIVPLDR